MIKRLPATPQSGLARWIVIAALLGMVIIGLLSWLHATQVQSLQMARQHLGELRQARIELTKGFLQASLADKPDTPFNLEDGLALLQQSIRTFEGTLVHLGMSDREETAGFRRSVEGFLRLLSDWRAAGADTRTMVTLRIAFANLERHADRLDKLGNRHIETLVDESARVYVWSLAGSLLALGFIFGIVLNMARRTQGAVAVQEKLDQARRISESRFARLFNEAPVPLCFVNRDGVLADRNRSFDQTFGYDHDELRTLDDWWSLAYPDPDYRARVQTTWNAAVAEAAQRGSDIASIEYTIACKDGSRRTMLVSGITLGEDILATFFDVTERNRAAQALKDARLAALNRMEDANAARAEAERQSAALRESQERLQLLIDHAPASLAMFDREMRYLAVSQRWRDDYFLGERELLGHSHYEIFPEIPDAWKEVHRRGMAGEIGSADEDRFARADGTVQWLRWEVRPWHAHDGGIGGIVIFSEDITRLVAARHEILEINAGLERRVTERTAELSAANRELESFAYAVSHDLRAPLRAMSGFSQALEEDYGSQFQGEAKLFLDQIGIASRRMTELIDGILTLSRSTRGELRRDRVDLSALAGRRLGELERAEPHRQVAVSVADGLVAWGDARMLEAVMTNLLDNAWKYTGNTAAPAIRVFAETRDGQRWFCIADNGAGFDPAHVGRLFKPFQRLHRQDEFPGIGIGLATVQRIVHRHGGEIVATAAPDKGATFCFTLPEDAGRPDKETPS